MWIFLLVSTLAWGIAEIFYKKGNLEKEKGFILDYSSFDGPVHSGSFLEGERLF